jgi:hypothetical protein
MSSASRRAAGGISAASADGRAPVDGSQPRERFRSGAQAIFGSVELPATERYAVLVDPLSTGIGTVTITLYDAPDITGSITVNGPPVAVPLPIPGQRARLTFEASSGQRISILGYQSNLQSTFPGDSLFYPVVIWRPDGSQLWSGNTGSARAFGVPTSSTRS